LCAGTDVVKIVAGATADVGGWIACVCGIGVRYLMKIIKVNPMAAKETTTTQ
jgi:hypothetical protein